MEPTLFNILTLDPKQLSRQKLTNSPNVQNRRRPFCYSHRLIVLIPPRPLLLYNVQLGIKDTNLPDINISHFKNCTKIPHDIDILCCQPKIFG
jgi:hypothetical protein